MRCLTLAEALCARGHAVSLMASIIEVPWLRERLLRQGVEVISCEPDSLDVTTILELAPDWVVVDSYWIDPGAISGLSELVHCLAIIDGDDRGIEASLYLDQNLGSESLDWPEGIRPRLLSGSRFAMIRDDVLEQRRGQPALIRHTPPKVLTFMGGTDPNGVVEDVVMGLVTAEPDMDLTAVCSASTFDAVAAIAADRGWISVVEPTATLASLLGGADVIVSAAGTSAWEVCALAVPAVTIGIVDNQREGLAQIRRHGLALTIDAIDGASAEREQVAESVGRLLVDGDLRRRLSTACLAYFDGAGKHRVVEAMERVVS